MEKEKIILGIDDGGKFAGYAIYSSPDILEAGEINVQNTIKSKMDTRRGLRRTRRAKLGSRKKRFDNRKSGISPCIYCGRNSKSGKDFCTPCDKLLAPFKKNIIRRDPNFYALPAPSIKAKKDCVLRVARKLKEKYGIREAIVEVAKFDFQKLRNPDISKEEYQQGMGYGYHTVKQALSFLYGYKCSYCGKDDTKLEVEHIKPRGQGGTDRWENLCLSCMDCNRKKGNRTPEQAKMKLKIKVKSLQSFIYASHVQAGKTYLVQELRKIFGRDKVRTTTGSWTSYYRKVHDIEKTHANDAIVIASLNFSGLKPEINIDKTQYYKVKPLTCKVKQQYKASIYPSNRKLNNQFVKVNNKIRKKRIVNDFIKDRITGQKLYRGDLIQLNGITGRINKILSTGSIGILISSNGTKKEKIKVPKNVKVFSRERIVFESCREFDLQLNLHS